MKFGATEKVVAVVVAGCAVLAAIRYIDRTPPRRLASLLGITVTVSDMQKPTPSPSTRADLAIDSTSASLGVVAVQTFSGPTLVRQGTGTAVSSDGLVLTTVAIAPYGSGSFVYQVSTAGGQVLRARRVTGDSATGLVLLKAESGNFDAVLFAEEAPAVAGAQLEATGARVVLSRFSLILLPTWLISNDGSVLSLDRSYGHQFDGARLLDSAGRSVGVLRWATVPTLIHSGRINAFLEKYLNTK